QRREARPQVDGAVIGRGQQVGVPPDRRRPGGDRLPRRLGGDGLVVIGDLEGTEAVVTDVEGLGWVGARALPTGERFDESHVLPPHRSGIGTWWESPLVAAASSGPSL